MFLFRYRQNRNKLTKYTIMPPQIKHSFLKQRKYVVRVLLTYFHEAYSTIVDCSTTVQEV